MLLDVGRVDDGRAGLLSVCVVICRLKVGVSWQSAYFRRRAWLGSTPDRGHVGAVSADCWHCWFFSSFFPPATTPAASGGEEDRGRGSAVEREGEGEERNDVDDSSGAR